MIAHGLQGAAASASRNETSEQIIRDELKDHLKYIARKGHIVCDYGVSRGIRVLRRPS